MQDKEKPSAPAQRLVRDLNRMHPEHEARRRDWDRMHLLYAGGHEIRSRATEFLIQRPKELGDVYKARVERFTYANHVGTSVDYYLAAEFEVPPRIETDKAEIPEKYSAFMNDCSGNGTSFVEMFREVFRQVLVHGASYILVDLPPKTKSYNNRLEEEQSGQLDPFLRVYEPRQAINWSHDSRGNLEWIVFHVRTVGSQPFGECVNVDRWYMFDRTSFQTYERQSKVGEEFVPDDAQAKLVGIGNHGLAAKNIVPVVKVEAPEGLWLMNRAFLIAVDHLNTDNVLGWALFMSALAMPVLITDGTVNVTLSEAGFLQLPIGSSIDWTEPGHTSTQILLDRAAKLVEDIFRQFYLIAQARSNEATPAAQSGFSKQQDMAPSKKILSLFGDLLREAMQKSLDMVSVMREDQIKWDVSGFEFPEDPVDQELKTIQTAMGLSIPSLTLERELYKKAAEALMPDANSDIKKVIAKEIDAADSKEDRAMQMIEKSSVGIGDRFAKKLGKK